MDNFGLSDRLCDMDESDLTRDFMPDLNNMLQQEMEMVCQDFENEEDSCEKSFNADTLNLDNYDMASPDWLDFFDDPVLNDKMMSEANPVVRSEHSYSSGTGGVIRGDNSTVTTVSGSGTLLPVKLEPTANHSITLDEHTGPAINPKFLELDNSRGEAMIVNAAAGVHKTRCIQTVTVTKQEPRIIVKNEPIIIEARRTTQQQSLLKPTASILLTRQNQTTTTSSTVGGYSGVHNGLNHTRYEMRTSPMSDDMDEGIYLNVMPMTPPGSSSDSDGAISPRQSPTPSPIRQVVFKSNHREINPATAIYSQPIPTSGVLVLTEEEKRTLISEGYPIPTKLPLTKIEEKNLKKVRRKIKNKISAQESRRKRKEYMDHLEKKMEDIGRENTDLRKKCDKFELSNQNLMSQLQKLQNMIRKIAPQQASQTGICLMVMVLCFAVFFGDWLPSNFSSGFGGDNISDESSSLYSINSVESYTTATLKPSRTLLMMGEDEKSCGNEPWPLMLARKSFDCIANLISPTAVDEPGVWANASDMPIIIAAAHENSITA